MRFSNSFKRNRMPLILNSRIRISANVSSRPKEAFSKSLAVDEAVSAGFWLKLILVVPSVSTSVDRPLVSCTVTVLIPVMLEY